MIRGIFLLLLVFCLALPAPAGAVWLFGGKKKEETAAAPEPAEAAPTIYIAPKEGAKPWALDKLLNRPEEQALNPLFNNKLFEKLTPEMLTIAYAPKTQEELGMIAVASKIEQIGTIADMRKASKERMAAAKKKTDDALKAMLLQAEKERAAALQKAYAADHAPAAVPAAAPVGNKEKPAKRIMLDPGDPLKKPARVFKEF